MEQTGFDWREILFDLRRLGMMPTAVSGALGGAVSERALRDYAEETREPSHVRGELILALWEKQTGKARADAPRRPVLLRSMPTARVVRA
ncbi:hypothetical protein NFI99_26245 [Burkholderia glumae]|uniref:Uncharacterized protein n=1 Tax=Burkholderia glumae TaxID=337 RepID=A0ABY5BDJ2_BURGL|nr:hypothetical protein [Burkholderia glumae]QTP33503.1 hypothetical protein B7759_02097 [Burkholderia glumae]USS45093.1 hypothetical protein NFI99_26245 [Burkholderia glumae]